MSRRLFPVAVAGLLLAGVIASIGHQAWQHCQDPLLAEAADFARLNGLELVSFSGSRRAEWGGAKALLGKGQFRGPGGQEEVWWFLSRRGRDEAVYLPVTSQIPETLERGQRLQAAWDAGLP